jgi:hypothetical protein
MGACRTSPDNISLYLQQFTPVGRTFEEHFAQPQVSLRQLLGSLQEHWFDEASFGNTVLHPDTSLPQAPSPEFHAQKTIAQQQVTDGRSRLW